MSLTPADVRNTVLYMLLDWARSLLVRQAEGGPCVRHAEQDCEQCGAAVEYRPALQCGTPTTKHTDKVDRDGSLYAAYVAEREPQAEAEYAEAQAAYTRAENALARWLFETLRLDAYGRLQRLVRHPLFAEARRVVEEPDPRTGSAREVTLVQLHTWAARQLKKAGSAEDPNGWATLYTLLTMRGVVDWELAQFAQDREDPSEDEVYTPEQDWRLNTGEVVQQYVTGFMGR
jgi:hypothetical protein